MQLKRVRPYLTKAEVVENKLVFITKPVPKQVRQLVTAEADLAGTILDKAVNFHGGGIPIPSRFRFCSLEQAKRVMEKPYLSLDRTLIGYLTREKPELVSEPPDGSCLYVPPGVSISYVTDDGLDLMSTVQKRFDDMVSYYQEWVGQSCRYDRRLEWDWVKGYNRLVQAVSGVLFKKGGLFDRAGGCLWEYSLRAVVVPDPTLQLNEVELPLRVLARWVSKPEFRKVHNIPDDIPVREAVRLLAGKRVLLGRNPSHDCSNLLSFKIRVRG